MTASGTRGLEPLVAPARSDLRVLMVILGLVGASIAAGLAVWFLGVPGDDGASSVAIDEPSFTAESEGEETVEAEATDEPIPLPLVTYELFLARDPFEPVVPEPVTGPSEPGTPAPGGGTGTTDPSSPNGNGNSTGSGNSGGNGTSTGNGNSGGNSSGTANGGCTGTSEVVCDGRVLTVIEVAEENGELFAVIQVDTMRYRVGVGDVFADNFQVVSISPDEVKVLYGDRVSSIEVGDNALK